MMLGKGAAEAFLVEGKLVWVRSCWTTKGHSGLWFRYYYSYKFLFGKGKWELLGSRFCSLTIARPLVITPKSLRMVSF